jgi:hypothetical protein
MTSFGFGVLCGAVGTLVICVALVLFVTRVLGGDIWEDYND